MFLANTIKGESDGDSLQIAFAYQFFKPSSN